VDGAFNVQRSSRRVKYTVKLVHFFAPRQSDLGGTFSRR